MHADSVAKSTAQRRVERAPAEARARPHVRTAPVLAALVGLLCLAADASGQCAGTRAVGGLFSGVLVDDCDALLASRATLVGTGEALNWSTSLGLPFWDGVTLSGFGPIASPDRGVSLLSLNNFGLAGTIPEDLGDLSNPRELVLSNNALTGEIPEELGDLSRLESLNLSGNSLTGEIPEELGDLSRLESLNLSGNALTGEIPEWLGDLSNLRGLILSSTQLTGEIPEWLGDLSNLRYLDLSGNALTGEIPEELGDLSNLDYLNLSSTQLTGEIPEELGDLSNLEDLNLSGNSLTGEIPEELGALSNLRGLNLSSNQLTGEIPEELGDLSNLEGLNLSSNQLTGEIPEELGDLSYILVRLDLSSNALTGEIPEELGALSNLGNLSLHRNYLSGCIPQALQRFESDINPQRNSVFLPTVCSDGIVLSLSPNSVSEGAAATDITVTASLVTASLGSTALPTATTVTVSRTGGTATPGTDYAAISAFTVTIAADATSGTATLSFDPTEDILAEGDETVVLTGRATGLTSGTATLTITDSAATAVTLSLSPNSVSEGAAATDITVTASLSGGTLPTATTVTVSRTGGTATPDTDYPAISAFTVTIAAGATSGTAQLSFDPAEDTTADGVETVILTGSARGLSSGTATLTITENDTTTAVTLSLSPNSVSEPDRARITVTAALNGVALPTATTVTVSVTGGTATPDTDYPAISAFTVTIAAGATSGTAQLSFYALREGLAEGDETVILTGSATGLSSGTTTLTIIDEDRAPTDISLSLSPSSVGEGDAATDITVTASLHGGRPLSTATTVTVTVSRRADVFEATPGDDYAAISAFTVTIEAGATSGTAQLSFDPIENSLADGGKRVYLTGSATGLSSGEATLGIIDNDPPTEVTLALGPRSVSEGADATEVRVVAWLPGAPLPTATTVTVSVTGGTATPDTDYPAISSFTVTVAAETVVGVATLSFDPTEDSLAEGDETVILTGLATGLSSGTATLTITDNETATAVRLSLNPNSVSEGADATDITVTAALNGAAVTTATTVTVSRTGGTAAPGTDYPAISSFTVTIAADATSGTAQLSFDPTEDSLREGDETVVLTGRATDLTAGTATLTITDNDTAPTAISLSLSPSSVGEGDAATDITVTASLSGGTLPTATTVTVSRTGGTATSGTDYPAISAFTVTIAAEATSGTATLSFDPTEDTLAEGDETVILTGTASGLTPGTATLTITDNDSAPTAVTLSLSPNSISEGDAATDITVTASLGSTALPTATTVSVSRTGGTATPGTDYPAIGAFSITIAAEATSGTATLSFDPTEDILAEGDETVVLTGGDGPDVRHRHADDHRQRHRPDRHQPLAQPQLRRRRGRRHRHHRDRLARQHRPADRHHGQRHPDGGHRHPRHRLPGHQQLHRHHRGRRHLRHGHAQLRPDRGHPGGR